MEENKCDVLTIMLVIGTMIALVMSSFALANSITLKQGFVNYLKEQRDSKMVISKDYDKGQTYKEALKAKMPILTMVYTDWCGVSVAAAPQFDDLSNDKDLRAHMAVAYINGDQKENKALMERYKIQGYPTILILTKDGEKIAELSNADFMDGKYNKKKLIKDIFKKLSENEG